MSTARREFSNWWNIISKTWRCIALGPVRPALTLMSHAQRPFPSCRCANVCHAVHFVSDMTLGLGEVSTRLHEGGVTLQPGTIVDSHCHLDFAPPESRADIIARARAACVGTMLTICTKLAEFDTVRAIAALDPDIWCSVGVHPHEAAAEAEADASRLVALATDPKVIGIGETGLDFYYDHSPRPRQAELFRAHAQASRETGLPLIVHTRDADPETIEILHQERPLSGVIHCFSTGRELAEAALEMGFYISISGIVTFEEYRVCCASHRAGPAARPASDRDGRTLSGAGAEARKDQRKAGLHRPYGGCGCRAEKRAGRGTCAPNFGEFLPAFQQGRAPVRVTMLGSGPSWGVPRIGGNWGACDPANPRNRRRRVSVLVEENGARVLVDTSPDLREQLLDAKVTRLDAVLVSTHAHADHLHGIDDLRMVNRLICRSRCRSMPIRAPWTRSGHVSAMCSAAAMSRGADRLQAGCWSPTRSTDHSRPRVSAVTPKSSRTTASP